MSRRPGKSPSKPAVVNVVLLPHGRDLPLPRYQTSGAAGMDLLAAVPADKPVKLKRGARVMIPTGLIFEIPRGMEAQVRPRSGLAAKHGITVLNSPGTIDSDYRGEVQVILVNLGDKVFVIQRGERIAQMVLANVVQVDLAEAKTARKTARGAGGFGSTGLASRALTVPRVQKLSAKPIRKKASTKKKTLIAYPRRTVKSKSNGRR
jgi:dUTP pyrophosphatase